MYPILFNYRHSLELALKGILLDAQRVLDDPTVIPKSHSLVDLWRKVRPLLEKIEPGGEAELTLVDRYIRRFNELDPQSFTHRYPVDNKEKPTVKKELPLMNLRQVEEVVGRLSGFLDAAAMQASVILDQKRETDDYAPPGIPTLNLEL